MPPTMRAKLDAVHPQMLRADSDGHRKKVAERVERALQLVGLSKQDAAYQMGYSDAGTISRWCSGAERPLFDKLFAIEGFEDAYLVALAERNPRMAVETVITVRRTA
jgi:hypothetical protein